MRAGGCSRCAAYQSMRACSGRSHPPMPSMSDSVCSNVLSIFIECHEQDSADPGGDIGRIVASDSVTNEARWPLTRTLPLTGHDDYRDPEDDISVVDIRSGT